MFNLDDLGGFRAGRLCGTPEQLEFYTKILDAGPMVTRWLTTGYEIPFSKVPQKPLSAKNNKSCINNLDFAREELQRQVNCGILSEVSYKPLVVNPISCVYSNKWHLVVDCRLLNPYVTKRKIKLEDLRCVHSMVSRGAYMSTDDLEKGYWQVKLSKRHRDYVGVSLDGRYYVANVLILGICDAVFAFTKLVCPIVRYLRSRGINILVYIDDFFICHSSEHLAIKSRNFLLHTLIKCGWLLSVPKHKPVAQIKIFLGLQINSLKMQFEIPDEKIGEFFKILRQVKFQAVMTVKLLAKLLGLLNSFSRALGQIV